MLDTSIELSLVRSEGEAKAEQVRARTQIDHYRRILEMAKGIIFDSARYSTGSSRPDKLHQTNSVTC